MFLLCWAGQDHTDAVGLHVACIKANDSNGNVSNVNTEEERDGMNNERGLSRMRREGGGGRKDSWYQDWC